MVTWDIQRGGRAWGDEAMSRYQMTPEKTELVGGRLYWTEEERLTMLALLLENVGADKAVRLGSPSIWRGAIAAGKEFTTADNHRWTVVTRPIVEAFFHARFFLKMAVRYAALDTPRPLPSGYAALLYRGWWVHSA
jgi:hypothetical protein